MITDESQFGQTEIRRLEDNLLGFVPGRQWQIVTVTFPDTPDTDTDIRHTLTPSNAEHVDWSVLQSTGPVWVYKDGTADRTPWGAGFVILRSTTPGAQVTLLLSVSGDAANGRVTPTGRSPFFEVAGAALGTVGGSGALTYDSFEGPGVTFTANGTHWAIGYDDQGIEASLRIIDDDVVPFMFRRVTGDYYLQPGPQTQAGAGGSINLGNPLDSFSSGWWTSSYIVTGNFEAVLSDSVTTTGRIRSGTDLMADDGTLIANTNGGGLYVINVAGSSFLQAIGVDSSDRTFLQLNSAQLRIAGGVVSTGALGAYRGYVTVTVDGLGSTKKLPIYD
jgi:hypothetical protein